MIVILRGKILEVDDDFGMKLIAAGLASAYPDSKPDYQRAVMDRSQMETRTRETD